MATVKHKERKNTHCMGPIRLNHILSKAQGKNLAGAYLQLNTDEKNSIIAYLCRRYKISPSRKYIQVNKVDLYRFWILLDDFGSIGVDSDVPWDRDAQMAHIILIIMLRQQGIMVDSLRCKNPPSETLAGWIPELRSKVYK
jgi:hypothetical protein